jgi:hypothetical protein
MAPRFGMTVDQFKELVKKMDEDSSLETDLVQCVHMRHTMSRCPDAAHENWDYEYPALQTAADKRRDDMIKEAQDLATTKGMSFDHAMFQVKQAAGV